MEFYIETIITKLGSFIYLSLTKNLIKYIHILFVESEISIYVYNMFVNIEYIKKLNETLQLPLLQYFKLCTKNHKNFNFCSL